MIGLIRKRGKILTNCYEALPKAGKIYVIENWTNRIEDSAALLSLNMAVVCESFERTEYEYKALIVKAGFKFVEQVQVNDFQGMIVGQK